MAMIDRRRRHRALHLAKGIWRPIIGLFLLSLGGVGAADSTADEAIVSRYEDILTRSPVEGPSFDKLLQIYQESEGLEKLDARWAPLSAQPGAKGATFSLLRGLLADRMGHVDAARTLLQAATQAQPDDFHGWMALGDFEVRQGKWADAITALQKGLATPVQGEDRLALYRKLGQAQQRNLDVPAALATWKKMIDEFPKDSFAVEEAGTSELEAEQFDEAKKTFQKLVDLTEPNSMNRVQAMMHLAEVDDRQGKTEAAVHGYEAILPLTAESSWLNRELRAQIEQIYRREDDLAGLAQYYQKWTTDNPKDVEALLRLSGVLGELGKKPEALEALRQAAALAPDRHEVRESLAQGMVEAKRYDEAIAVETALTADDPTEPRYWETMGNALWLKTQPPTAESKKAVLDAWGHIAPPDSKDVAAILSVADLCRDHGLTDEAMAGYQRALAISPDASDIREKAVKLLVDLKREDEAWKLLDAMTDGPLATAANYLKLASLDQGFDRKDAAMAAIQKGLALAPNNFDLLSLEWSQLAEAQKWSEAAALFDRLVAAAPNPYFVDQLEIRQVQALASAGELDDTEKKLRAKLGADPGLTEGEMRLLMRILVQQSDADLPKVIEEARRRFPQSVSLARIEIDYNRRQGNSDAAIADLQRLIQTAPLQKADWLAEIVRIQQDGNNLDAALQAAQQIIDASPASASAYLTYADLAFADGKADAAVEKLQAAIKLSDKPNDIRLRLARYYLENDQAAKARAIYDEAFAAADTPQDKQAIVRAMVPAYYQDGQIDELINRFKKEQASEEGGWRYGLYLSIIYDQMQDYGSARRELAKSLAVHPQDTGLLRSLIDLAEKDNDRAELLHYREMLVEVDPSAANKIALANEYALQGKDEDAWHLVQKNLDEIAKDPLAWKDVLNQIADPAYSAKITSALEEAIRAKGDLFGGLFALAQFQLQQGDLAGAKKSLWAILDEPLPVAPPPVPGTQPSSSAPARSLGFVNFYQGPLFQRVSQTYVAINEVQQLLASNQNPSLRQMGIYRQIYFNRPGMATVLTPESIKDHALLYLSVIAVQEKTADDFLKRLEDKFEVDHAPLSERLAAYAMIQAREPLLKAIEEEAQSPHPDKDLDSYCYIALDPFTSANVDDATRQRAEAAHALLETRLASDPQFKTFDLVMKINHLSADGTPEGIAKKKAAVAEYLSLVDHKSADQLLSAIMLSAQVGDWQEIKKLVNEFTALDPSKRSLTANQQLGFLPLALLQQATTTQETVSKEVIPVVLQMMRIEYPATPPQAALSSMGMTGGYGYAFYNANAFPPPNRYFPAARIGTLEPIFQQLKARDLMPAMYDALDQEEKDLGDWRKIYPTLMRIYFQWWDGKHDDAIAAVRKLLAQEPSDDFRSLLASLLSQDKQYDEAITVLESITAQHGPDYIQTQKELLHVARLANNTDVGQKAGLRLLGMRLPQQEQMQLMDDLRAVGLKDKADEMMSKLTNRPAAANLNQIFQGNNQTVMGLNQAMNDDDSVRAVQLARQILNQDPTAAVTFGNPNFMRLQALNALKKFGQLPAYTAEIEQQLQAAPDSVRLNWLAAEAYQNMEGTIEKTYGLKPLPQWLKLERKGNQFFASISSDGATWNPVGSATLEFSGRLYVGMWVGAERTGQPVKATFSHVAFTGKVSRAIDEAAPASISTTNAPSATAPSDAGGDAGSTNAASVAPSSPDPLLQTWQQADVGRASTPGSVASGAKDEIVVTGSLDRSPRPSGLHFVYQALDGDGTVIARMDDLVEPANITERQSENRPILTGLMMRESLGASSGGFGVALSPTDGAAWLARNYALSFAPPPEGAPAASAPPSLARRSVRELGAAWIIESAPQFSFPLWLKLTRHQQTFTGSYSSDGKSWQEIFSQDLVMKDDAMAGVFGTSHFQRASEISLKSVQVTGAAQVNATAPPKGADASSGLPAPWSYLEIGKFDHPGNVKGDGASIDITTPYGPSPNTSDNRGSGGAYQPIHGDGEVVAQVVDVSPQNDGAWGGVTFSEGSETEGASIRFFSGHFGRLGYSIQRDTAALALRYYRKVAELDPKNLNTVLTVADQLAQTKNPDAAADLYLVVLKNNTGIALNHYGQMMQVFRMTNRLPDLINVIMDWSPPPTNPMNGAGADPFFMLIQIGSDLQQNKNYSEAEQILRKALTLDTYQSKQDAVAALVQVLIAEGKKEDAATEIEKMLLTKDQSAPAQSPILGFTLQNTNQTQNWLQFMGWNSNGMVDAPILRFLQMANDLGLSARLRAELKDRSDKNRSKPNGQIDEDRMSAIFLAVIARDPAYRAEVEQLMKDYPSSTLTMGSTNANAFMILSQQLEKWPQERPMALRLVKQVYDGMSSSPGNLFYRNIAGLQMVRLALAANDDKAAQAALRSVADDLHQQRSINIGQVNLDQALLIIHWMLREGMVKEAEDTLADVKSSPQFMNNAAYYQDKTGQLENEIAFAKGESGSVALVYGLADAPAAAKEKGTLFVWQLNAGQKTLPGSAYFGRTPWTDGNLSRPTTYKIEVSCGPDEGRLTRVATYTDVATRGSAPIKLPAGTQVLQATLIQTKLPVVPGQPALPKPDLSKLAPAALGHRLILGAGENLLPNADFKVTPDASGTAAITDWLGIAPSDVEQDAGGPLLANGCQWIDVDETHPHEIISARVPLQSNTDYIFSGWFNFSGTIAYRCFDASGVPVGGNTLDNENGTDWLWRAWVFKGNATSHSAGEPLDPKAAFIDFVFRPNRDFRLAGISLKVRPAPPSLSPPPAAK